MKVAIIIITYNNQKDVVDAISSVRNQTYTNWQCITIDNGSSDATVRVITDMVADDPRFTSFRKPNEGPSAGRNLGYSKIDKETEYVHFLDGDDLLDANFLIKMISFLDEHPEVGLLGCQYDIINENGDFISEGNRSRFKIGFLGFPKKLNNNKTQTPFESFFAATGQGAFAVFRTRIFSQTQGYTEAFWTFEDSDIFCQMALLSEVHYISDHLYKVRRRSNSLSHFQSPKSTLFRDKWDNYYSENQQDNILIEKSLKYYYTRHKPLRDFKVGFKALRKSILRRDHKCLYWSIQCFKAGLNDLFFHFHYNSCIKKRELAENDPQGKLQANK